MRVFLPRRLIFNFQFPISKKRHNISLKSGFSLRSASIFLLNKSLHDNKFKSCGFSLIEIIIVITLFAITTVAVTTSYISFEARERVKNAALQAKNDLRLAQNKAQNGDKITDGTPSGGCRTPEDSLIGWYVAFDITSAATSINYKLAGDCMQQTTAYENKIYEGSDTIKLPTDVSISKLSLFSTSSTCDTNVEASPVQYTQLAVLFRPLDYSVGFYNNSSLSGPGGPDTSNLNFVNGTTGNPTNNLTGVCLAIELTSPDGTYQVKVNQSGKIEEYRP